ncbi:probable G-protein coupled receptor Mth-like 1 [Cloeon dipterum]|uniref:probable G-protein coupled receptor Mth-like 1 n=1 Tax=Cloeon dipterum TaxID=197152 RepID=UPI00321F78C0
MEGASTETTGETQNEETDSPWQGVIDSLKTVRPHYLIGVSESVAIILLMLSIVFLTMNICRIWKSPNKRGSMFGKVIIGLSTVLLTGYVCKLIFVVILFSQADDDIKRVSDAVDNLLNIFNFFFAAFYMSSFIWINVFCFEVYYSFRCIQKSLNHTNESHASRFIKFSVYAASVPVLCTIFAGSCSFRALETLIIMSVFGLVFTCVITTIANIVLLIMTTIVKRDVRFPHSHQENTFDFHWRMVRIFFLIFGVAGLLQVCFIISLLAGYQSGIISSLASLLVLLKGFLVSVIYMRGDRIQNV